MDKKWHVFAGEWAGHGPDDRTFSIGYVGKLQGHDSHGFAVPRFPADVAGAIIDEHRHVIASTPDAEWLESLEWGTGDEAGAVVLTWLDPASPARVVIRPDADGLYGIADGWMWATVDAQDCYTVVTPDVLKSFVTVHSTPVGRVHGTAHGTFDEALNAARADVDRYGETVRVVGLGVDWLTFENGEGVDRWALIDAGDVLTVIEP